MRSLFRIFVATLLGLTTAIAVRTAMWAGPSLFYRMSRPSIRSECAAIRAGMTFSDVDTVIHARSSPLDESLSIGGFAFSNYGEFCQVDLDPATHKVLKTEIVDGPGGVE
jgi:hypothetical protein